ncbi:unnamed protein product [Dibothriocephalus latus]|uniref:Sm domain-containing protein n=1 Tax=Dibothriocephalus latus TaxID=60516 RepID=A0A3P6T5R3_DIBLA|nr:unnamed protein product [Dibothriocephalus latus]
MNVVLEQTEEYVDGQLKNKYGDTFIRGNNANRFLVFYISTQKRGGLNIEIWLASASTDRQAANDMRHVSTGPSQVGRQNYFKYQKAVG